MKQTIGIYSGTFDPIHIGHISFAKEAVSKLGLDKAIFLPEQQPRGKRHVTEIHHRIALIKQAIQNEINLQILELPSKQFTIAKTLPELQKHFANTNLTFLIGSDIVHTFTYRWENLETLLREVAFVVGLRSSDSQIELETIFVELEAQYDIQIARSYITTTSTHIASSQIRANIVDTPHLPHPAMVDYIQKNNLYGSP
jgi:nicotinate-nucleotide adenylyltransferase